MYLNLWSEHQVRRFLSWFQFDQFYVKFPILGAGKAVNTHLKRCWGWSLYRCSAVARACARPSSWVALFRASSLRAWDFVGTSVHPAWQNSARQQGRRWQCRACSVGFLRSTWPIFGPSFITRQRQGNPRCRMSLKRREPIHGRTKIPLSLNRPVGHVKLWRNRVDHTAIWL